MKRFSPISVVLFSFLALAPFGVEAKKKHKKHKSKEVCDDKDRKCPPGCEDWLDFRLWTQELDAISNEDNFALNGFFIIPPDPIIAAGPRHVIAMTNSLVSIYRKHKKDEALERVYFAANSNFFEFARTPVIGDPWIVYNQFLDRFFLIAIGSVGGGTDFYIAVSKNATPESNNDFFHYRFFSPGEFDDYPKMAADGEAMYISSNAFRIVPLTIASQRIDIFNAQALAAGPSQNNIAPLFTEKINNYPPATTNGPLQLLFPLQPRPSDCPGAVEKVLFAEARLANPNAQGFFAGDTIRVHAYPTPLANINRVFVDVPISPFTGAGPQFAVTQRPPIINPGGLVPLEVFFPGGFNNGVISKNSIWTSHSIFAAGTTRIITRWYELDARISGSNLQASLKQFGTIDTGDTTSQVYPSINVDKHDNMAIQFTLVGPQQYPEVAYTGRHACDPEGTVRFPLQRVIGGDLYYQLVAQGRNRYGDYSGLAIDPCDEKTFWLFNEYPVTSAQFQFGSDWSTVIGSFQVNKCGISCNAPQVEEPPILAIAAADTLNKIEFTQWADDENITSFPITIPSDEQEQD